MYVKIHASGTSGGNRVVVAVCDEDLIGKTLKGKNITIAISERFYKGERKTEKEVILLLKQTTNINLMGKKAVAAGMKAGAISKENVTIIQGVPHAQAFIF